MGGKVKCLIIKSVITVVTLSVFSVNANSLKNPGFESGVTDWNTYNQAGVENWKPRTGNNSAVLYGWNDGGFGGLWQDVPVVLGPGDIVNLTIYGLAESGYSSSSGDTFLQIQFWTKGSASASLIVKKNIYDELIAAADNWVQVSIVATNELNTVVTIKPVFGGGGWTDTGGNQSCFFDDGDLTITTANILEDPGFEDGTAWSYSDAGQEGWAARDWSYGGAFWSWIAGVTSEISQTVTVDPSDGKIYEFSIYGNAEVNMSSSANFIALILEFWEGGTLDSAITNNIYSDLTANRDIWRYQTLVATNLSDDITSVKMMLMGLAWNGSGGNQATKWDDVYLKQTIVPEPIGLLCFGFVGLLAFLRSRLN